MKEKIIKMIKFMGVSLGGWSFDFGTYLVLSQIFGVPINIANMIGSLVGVSIVFTLSTKKIFKNSNKVDIKVKFLIYVIYQVCLVMTVSKLLLLLKDELLLLDIEFVKNYVDVVVKVMVAPFTVLINYVVVKNLIEKL